MLKHIVLLSACMLLLLSHNCQASSGTNPYAEAFKSGNWNLLAKTADHRIEISINGKSGLYEYTESADILKRFFQTHRPLQADIIQDNRSVKGAGISVLKYVSDRGVYKITLYTIAKSTNIVLEQIRIEQIK